MRLIKACKLEIETMWYRMLIYKNMCKMFRILIWCKIIITQYKREIKVKY